MIRPDAERILALRPSLILVSGMTRDAQGTDPFEGLAGGAARIEYLPTSQTIADIERDIRRVAFLIGDEGRGEAVARAMRASIDETRAVTRGIPADKRPRVLFELAPSPAIYSFGSGVYLDEALEAAGAANALSGRSGWLAVSAEEILARDPDVILTNVDFLPDPVAEIMGRPGWSGVKAVREGRVFRIDADASSQPAPAIANAIRDMARLLHPEAFRD
jgi:iron complex transport system substrate-binding protein